MRGLILFFLIFFVCSCKDNEDNKDASNSNIEGQLAQNESSKQLWQSQGINTYQLSYTCTFTSGCGMWVSYVMVDGEYVSGMAYVDDIGLLEVTEEELSEYDLYTVIGLFDYIEDSLDKGFVVNVEYDAIYGYPISFGVCNNECESQPHPIEVSFN